MARIPAPKRTADGCIEIGGLKVCPHLVHLTADQVSAVRKMHERNVMQSTRAMKKSPKKKKKAAKRSR